VNNEQCHVCGSDPGPGSRCGDCGARQYRYATEDLQSTITLSADVAAGLKVPPGPDQPQPRSTQGRSGDVERTDVFSQTEQRPEVGHPLKPFGIGPYNSGAEPSPSRSILLRMVLLLTIIFGVLVTQFPEWRETQRAAIPTAVTLPVLDPNASLSAPRLLASWDDLALGDCVLWPGTEADFPTVVDCRSAHDAEISAVASLTQNSWPFAEETFDLSDQCLAVFAAYVGQTFSLSQWRSGWVAPSEEEWGVGVRNYQCYVYLRENRTVQRAYKSGT
jgi:hypothetical protein